MAVAVALGIAVALGAFAHEMGHALTARLFREPINSVGVAPGVELYPRLRRIPWDGWIAYVDHGAPPEVWQAGLCKLMGCGTTAIVAYVLLGGGAFSIGTGRPITAVFPLTAAVVFAWDILMYAAMPQLGLRHAVFVGGSDPEPLLGARQMGMPLPLAWALLAFHAVAFHALLWWCLRKWRRKPAI